MFHLYKYKTPQRYLPEFKKAYSILNVNSVKTLSTILLLLASLARGASFFYYDDLTKLPNYTEFSISNITQIAGCIIFLTLSTAALKQNWTPINMNRLSIGFCFYLLSTTFSVSYIVSMHNTKNTLAVFLIGIMIVSIFFALNLKKIIALSVFILFLFLSAMINTDLSIQEKFLSVIASFILAFLLYTVSRYNYFFKSEHFIQVKQLEEKNREINMLNHQKGEILAFVAHDLRAPLNNIEALSTILIDEVKDEPRIELKMIQNAAVHAKEIINDLIEVVQEEKIPLNVKRTEMLQYLRAVCVKWLTNMNEHRKIELLTDEQVLFASLNEPKFTRVMDNLIGNALKFSPADSPVQIIAVAENEFCLIKIRDFGIGIPKHLQPMLFDQFSKAGRPGLKGEKSLGLGLHITSNIISDHGGELQVLSEENMGTTFIISLPLLPAVSPAADYGAILSEEGVSLN